MPLNHLNFLGKDITIFCQSQICSSIFIKFERADSIKKHTKLVKTNLSIYFKTLFNTQSIINTREFNTINFIYPLMFFFGRIKKQNAPKKV